MTLEEFASRFKLLLKEAEASGLSADEIYHLAEMILESEKPL